MKCGVLSRSTTGLQSSSLGKTLDKFLDLGARNIMASGGRLLGLQLPPVPSPLSDFMPACVRSTHTGDAKEFSGSSSSAGLLAVSSKLDNLEQPQALESLSSFELRSYTEQDVEIEKVVAEDQGNTKEKTESGSSSSSSNCTVEGDATLHHPEDVGENLHSQSRGLRFKLSSMLSLEKRVTVPCFPLVTGHSSQFMMEMSGFQSTRRTPMADSKMCAAIQKESIARIFDLYDERNLASVPAYGAACGGHVGRLVDASDMGVKPDLSWIEEKCNDAWGTEPWHSDQRNSLMKTLHVMRCDIESLKMMLRSLDLPVARGGPLDPHLHETLNYTPYMHSVMMRRSSAMSEFKKNSCRPSDDEQICNKELLKEEKELAQTVEKDRISEAVLDLCASEKSPSEKDDESEEPISVWSHGSPVKRKHWWKEILAAFGLTVWVITGAVLVAKAIGVPNLGVSNNVAYNGFWGRSADEEAKTPAQDAMGVVELTAFSFNDTIKKRPTFVMFYAPWCPHCQRLHPVWTQLAGVLNKKGYNVQLAIVDATKHTRLADKYEMPGFPTLIMFKNGMPVGRHRGARDIDTLMSFIDNNKERSGCIFVFQPAWKGLCDHGRLQRHRLFPG